jgi:phenylacetate-CoA ligase
VNGWFSIWPRRNRLSWIHNNLILPLAEPERHWGLGRRLRELERFDRLPEAKQRAESSAKVMRLLTHAYDTVPYYRQVFDEAGFHPSEWTQGQNIPIPLTSRDTLRVQQDQMVSRRYRAEQLQSASTGGTTNTPVRLWRDIEGLRQKIALQYHLNRTAGYDQGDPTLLIWGAQRDLEMNPSWKRKFYDEQLMHHFTAPAGQISDLIFQRFRDRLNERKPKVMFGYGVTMARFAQYLESNNLSHHNPKVIIVTAEAITAPEREYIERVFQCRVTDQYGSRDVGMVAMNCEHHTGMHFHPAGSLTEFVHHGTAPDGGTIHRLIITDLMNYGMPLIRYDTGDCVLLDDVQCPCGRWYPRVKTVLGRALDTFVLADGTEIPGLAMANQLLLLTHSFRYITQLQVIQKDYDKVQVRYVTAGSNEETERELAQVSTALQRAFKVAIRCTMVKVQDIPRAASGKLRLCISEVPRPGQTITPEVNEAPQVASAV